MQTQGPHQAETSQRQRQKLAQAGRKEGRHIKKKQTKKTIESLTLQYSNYTFIEIITSQPRSLR